ncbi:sigma-54 dependent transcriptional regulator [Aquipseudomonas alcaligenes]|nr:sigma-54 dependent transcriptional regulator [Pseudomonas alcaligenes]
MPENNSAIVVGTPAHDSYALLVDGLRRQGCRVHSCAALAELDGRLLADAGLVFVFASGLATAELYAQVGTVVRQAGQVSLVPIVEYVDQEKAAALLELGCVDYLLSPFSEAQLAALLHRHEQAAAAQEGFVSCSQAGRRLLAMAQRVAMTRAPILITGETGTGKELMARYIHRFSAEGDAPFIAVNCAAIPEQMLESILFGHEKGAFTGAVTAQPGKFELANGGTLLLDEIGELPLALQAKLLRVLQEQRVERLGGRKEIALNVRIIAATNRDLQDEVSAGRFRADLMFRLDVLPLHISPLRERKEDVLPLARRFICQYAPQEQQHDLLTAEACRALLAHDWPGNVRELENTLQRALVLRNGLFIQPRDLGLQGVALPAQEPERSPLALAEGGKAALRASGKWAEYQHVIDTIRRCGGHKTRAAESLGMTTRALRYRLNAMREQGVQLPL